MKCICSINKPKIDIEIHFVYNFRQQFMQQGAATPSASVRVLLRRVGLDEREIDVYLALLPLKMARVSAIAKAARQSRSHTYLVLRALQERGFVSEVERNKVLHFVAEPPQRIITYLETQKSAITSTQSLVEGAIPFLSSLTSSLADEPRVTLLKGRDGMLQVYKDTLFLEEGFVSFFNPQAMYTLFDENIVHALSGRHGRLRGKDLLVENEGARRYIAEVEQDELYTIRVLPKAVQFGIDALVFGDVVALFSYDVENTIIRIENRPIADAFRAWHAALWAMSQPAAG